MFRLVSELKGTLEIILFKLLILWHRKEEKKDEIVLSGRARTEIHNI